MLLTEKSQGSTLTFRQGASNSLLSNYAGTTDATLMAGFATENIGGRSVGYVGNGYANDTNKMLLSFDLSSLAELRTCFEIA